MAIFISANTLRAQDAGIREDRNGFISHETSCALFYLGRFESWIKLIDG
jgi:hypothetical protein